MLHIYWMSNWFKGYIERSNRSAITLVLNKIASDFSEETIEVDNAIMRENIKKELKEGFLHKDKLIEKYLRSSKKKKKQS